MATVHTSTSLSASFAARYPNAHPGTLESVEAMAVKGAPSSSKQQWVKAVEHFFQSGELIKIGDFVQVAEAEAADLFRRAQAVEASDADVAAAQKASK